MTGINELSRPEQSGQSNLTAEEGAELWKTYLEPLKSQGIRLGTPAPSSAPSGKTWLQDWLKACAGGCNPDFVALRKLLSVLLVIAQNVRILMARNHSAFAFPSADYYDVNATQFQLYLEDFHDTFQLPIWVTEWADQVSTVITSFIYQLYALASSKSSSYFPRKLTTFTVSFRYTCM